MNNSQLLKQGISIAERFQASADNALTALENSSQLVSFYENRVAELCDIVVGLREESDNILATVNRVIATVDETLALNKELEAENKRLNERIERGFE